MIVTVVGAISIAAVHSLAPDHWLPLVAVARSAKWSERKLTFFAALAALLHVVGSLLFAGIAIWLYGKAFEGSGFEDFRGTVAIWLLFGFGCVYALWGLKEARSSHAGDTKLLVDAFIKRRVGVLLIIMVFGAGDPIVPIMFGAYEHGIDHTLIVCGAYVAVLLAMIVIQSVLAYRGIRLIKSDWFERYSHSLSGVAIALTALGIYFLEG